MNTDRRIIQALGPSILLAALLAACSSDDSTTKPKTTSGAGGTTSTSGAGSTTSGSTGSGTTAAGSTTSGSTSSTSGTTAAGTTSGAGGAGSTGSTTSAAGGSGPTSTTTTASGTGGTGSGTGGTGAGGSGQGSGCPAPSAASGLISDFATMNVANQLTGGTDTWYGGGGTATVMNGAMHFVVMAKGMMDYPGVSALIASKPGMIGCVDLSAKYTAISFKISSPTNTSLLFEITSKEVAMMPDGSGFRKSFTLSSTPATVTINLADLMPPTFPSIGLTQSMMPGFSIAKDAAAVVFGVGTGGENLDITVDDVTFQ